MDLWDFDPERDDVKQACAASLWRLGALDVKPTARAPSAMKAITPRGVAAGDRSPVAMQTLTQSHGPVRKEAT